MSDLLTCATIVSNRIELADRLMGSIDVTDDVSGDIELNSGTSQSGGIDIGGQLTAAGRIMVDSRWDGDITIEEGTTSTSLIHLEGGLGNNSVLTINNSEGEFNAGGDILVGGAEVGFPPLPAIEYDGCIQIHDDSNDGSHGDLDGDIDINGCHASAADLGLTIDGAVNGTVTIYQDSCTYQVTWDDCP